MKLQFDAHQQFQLDAVAAVVDLFEGQPQGGAELSVIHATTMDGLHAGQKRTALGVGNALAIADHKLLQNARVVQARNAIEIENPLAPLEGWELGAAGEGSDRQCPHFSVEMETGTGKTYVYLRTIFELHRRFGFLKFVIVVPSVAIREGTLSNITLTGEHFRSLYDNVSFKHFVYDGRAVTRVQEFATSHVLQVMIINIDAFRKNFADSEEDRKSNVVYKPTDKLSGRAPIEYIQATRPIVIIDEPQSVDSTDRAQEAIKALNPLCTLRYSATHRNPYNLVYRLDPVRAFELRLVKQIMVASANAEGGANNAFVRVESVEYKKGIKAKLRIHAQGSDGPKEKSVTVKQSADLHALSNERACYAEGFTVAEINAEPGGEFVRFSNGQTLKLGEEMGGMRDDVWRVQIKHTIKRHLEKELQVRDRGIKVLSLFFVDRVANYRDRATGDVVKGKFALAFEEELTTLAQDPRYRDIAWLKTPIEKLHDGYFAQDKKGNFKDTNGSTKDDDSAYDKIMKNKEQLLSLEEPLRFIFSHSALREGWDNPNVFQICTLNETKSGMKKRQEIGRGLRLPVDQHGKRVFDDSINKLYVMANESYEEFARTLQKEYEDDCGVTFGKVPLRALASLVLVVEGAERPLGDEGAQRLHAALVEQKLIDPAGRLLPAFDPQRPDFALNLPEGQQALAPAVIDLLSSYRIERHITRAEGQLTSRLRKEVTLSPEFQMLWDRIKPKTTYRVEFDTDTLVARAIDAIERMPRIEVPKVRVVTGQLGVVKGGVTATAVGVAEERSSYGIRAIPDVLAYLQNETELTRGTLARILNGSDRLQELFNDPQRFMDAVAAALKHELHRLLVDGVKYERVAAQAAEAEWEMLLFKHEELVSYLNALKVKRSVYEYVVYDSEVERAFAQKLDQREDIKLFVKLPGWFEIETPVGKYNPDWAIVKHDSEALYLVRETKGTRDFLKLRTSEADKVRCGQKHFEALGVSFAVVVSADEV